MKQIPNHLAIIMDGNARWAKKQKKIKEQGHQAGLQILKKIISYAEDIGVNYITLFAFSSENWHRPKDEVSYLIRLIDVYLKKELNNLHKNGVKIKVIGNLDKLSDSYKKSIKNAEEKTKNNSNIVANIAFSYGSRQEIIDAVKKIPADCASNITEEEFSKYLYSPDMPDVDLLIRTGGKYRISNFLLWQAAYAELYFTDTLWPDFTTDDIDLAIEDFNTRKRSFGRRLDE